MKTRSIMAALAVAAAALFATSCNDFDVDELANEIKAKAITLLAADKYKFEFDESGICTPTGAEALSENDFLAGVNLYGWYYIEGHGIKADGSLEHNDFWKNMIGGSAHSLFFDGKKLTEYFYYDAKPALCYRTSDLNYQADGSFGPTRRYRVLAVTDDIMEVLEMTGVSGSSSIPNYSYDVYGRMSDEKLRRVQEEFNTDFNSLTK